MNKQKGGIDIEANNYHHTNKSSSRKITRENKKYIEEIKAPDEKLQPIIDIINKKDIYHPHEKKLQNKKDIEHPHEKKLQTKKDIEEKMRLSLVSNSLLSDIQFLSKLLSSENYSIYQKKIFSFNLICLFVMWFNRMAVNDNIDKYF